MIHKMVVTLLLVFLLLFTHISCGVIGSMIEGEDGGDTVNIEGLEKSCEESDLVTAMDFLKEAKIEDAYKAFKTVLENKADCPKAKFGIALTFPGVLHESNSVTSLLQQFGESDFNAAESIFGSTGILGQDELIHQGVTSLALAYDNQTHNWSSGTYPPTVLTTKSSYNNSISISVDDQEKETYFHISIPDYSLIKVGEEIDLSTYSSYSEMPVYFSIYGYDLFGTYEYFSNSYKAEGKVTFTKFSTTLDGEIEILFNDLKLYSQSTEYGEFYKKKVATSSSTTYTDYVAISGTVGDILTEYNPSYDDIPFDGFENGWRDLFKKIPDGYSADDIQSKLLEIASSLDKIYAYLEQPLEATDFLFTVPGGVIFSSTDFYINTADVNIIAATLKFVIAGIYLVNAYSFPVADFSKWFDDEGEFILSNDEAVTILNSFFTIKDSQYITKAKDEFITAVTHLKNAIDLVKTNKLSSGTFYYVVTESDIIDKLSILADTLLSSLTAGSVAVPDVSPSMTFDLKTLFESPPDSVSLSIDPFEVDEYDRVKVVEDFFKQFISAYTNLDLDNLGDYEYTFDRLGKNDEEGKNFVERMLAQYFPFYIAGHYYDSVDLRFWW